jgi:hypothetical protein
MHAMSCGDWFPAKVEGATPTGARAFYLSVPPGDSICVATENDFYITEE